MKHDAKIATVVVTYNRKDMLVCCLDRILAQSRPVDHIFLIDNASTDGTTELFKEKFGDNNLITYVRMDTNVGSAGGFHEGVKQAYEWGADWIWFLDDDIIPRPNCLEGMLKYEHISKCIHPSKVYKDGVPFVWEAIFDPSTCKTTVLKNLSFKHGKDFTFVNLGCFEGMLIHRDIVSQIGFPDERFFIGGDDTIYGFLASLYTNVIFLKNSIIDKQFAYSSIPQMSPTSLYYCIRNQFIMKEHVKKYDLLNRKVFNLNIALFFILVCTKHAWKNKKLKTIPYVCRGLIDGIRGRFYQMGVK